VPAKLHIAAFSESFRVFANPYCAEIEKEFKFLNDSDSNDYDAVSIHSGRCKQGELCRRGEYTFREVEAVQNALLQDTGSPNAHTTIAIKNRNTVAGLGNIGKVLG
jgi:hypothetical protein